MRAKVAIEVCVYPVKTQPLVAKQAQQAERKRSTVVVQNQSVKNEPTNGSQVRQEQNDIIEQTVGQRANG